MTNHEEQANLKPINPKIYEYNLPMKYPIKEHGSMSKQQGIKRYKQDWNESLCWMSESDGGKWVSHYDYEKLKSEKEALEKQVAEAYERGQTEMRERAVNAASNFGSNQDCEIEEAIRSLAVEKEDTTNSK